MASCRRCGEFLVDDGVHRCALGHRLWTFVLSVITMAGGAAISLIALWYFVDDPSETTTVLGVLAGMVIAHGVWSVARL